MSNDDLPFKVQARLNRVEYKDLVTDLEEYEGAGRGGRVRILMRLGLGVVKGIYVLAASADRSSHLAAVVDLPRAKPATKQSSTADTLDHLELMGMDPAQFKFGQSKK
jgi:hypothetical protein